MGKKTIWRIKSLTFKGEGILIEKVFGILLGRKYKLP